MTAFLSALLLVVQLVVPYPSAVIKQFDAIPIGQTREVVFPQGDGCNSCMCPVKRTSETYVEVSGFCHCTLVFCGSVFPPARPYK